MNSVNLIGRLTRDPELRTTNGGTPVCTLRLAVPRPPKDGSDQGAVFVDVTAFARQGEAVAEHMAKGRQVAVTGRLEYREWTGEDGSPRSRHEVVASQIDFVDPRQRPDADGGGA
ncbi:MAG: single-stranded DNA-binding protein [Actinomycetota bacterium]|nr:single-stranded DNA-binding protein [Actinomycetota bacterium]